MQFRQDKRFLKIETGFALCPSRLMQQKQYNVCCSHLGHEGACNPERWIFYPLDAY